MLKENKRLRSDHVYQNEKFPQDMCPLMIDSELYQFTQVIPTILHDFRLQLLQ